MQHISAGSWIAACVLFAMFGNIAACDGADPKATGSLGGSAGLDAADQDASDGTGACANVPLQCKCPSVLGATGDPCPPDCSISCTECHGYDTTTFAHCANGKWMVNSVPDTTCTMPDAGLPPSDCSPNCGDCMACTSNYDCAPLGECWTARCVNDHCQSFPVWQGIACSAGLCSGEGTCVSCIDDARQCVAGVAQICSNQSYVAHPECDGCSGNVAVAGKIGHFCALRADGSVWCWGENMQGQVGQDPNAYYVPKPTKVNGIPGVPLALAAGMAQTCALLTDGSVWCWGSAGTLGTDAVSTWSTLPVQAQIGEPAKQLDTAGTETCALLASGGVVCWGYSVFGPPLPLPSAVPGLGNNVTDLAVGETHDCVARNDGTAACWGYNSVGQLGSGVVSATVEPVTDVIGLPQAVKSLVAGRVHTCALLSDGSVWCWGSNTEGQLGSATGAPCESTGICQSTPTRVTALAWPAVAIYAGGWTTCAKSAAGEFVCWGDADAVPAPPLTGATAPLDIALGSGHACIVADDGSLTCWGDNTFGELGAGFRAQKSLPPVTIPVAVCP